MSFKYLLLGSFSPTVVEFFHGFDCRVALELIEDVRTVTHIY